MTYKRFFISALVIVAIITTGVYASQMQKDHLLAEEGSVMFEMDGATIRDWDQSMKAELIERREVCQNAEADIPHCYGLEAISDSAAMAVLEDERIINISVRTMATEKMTQYAVTYQDEVRLFGLVPHDVTAHAVVRNYPDPTDTEAYTAYDTPWYVQLFIWSPPQEKEYLDLAQRISRGV